VYEPSGSFETVRFSWDQKKTLGEKKEIITYRPDRKNHRKKKSGRAETRAPAKGFRILSRTGEELGARKEGKRSPLFFTMRERKKDQPSRTGKVIRSSQTASAAAKPRREKKENGVLRVESLRKRGEEWGKFKDKTKETYYQGPPVRRRGNQNPP